MAYDLIVIGGGPAGYVGAIRAATSAIRVDGNSEDIVDDHNGDDVSC